MMQTCSLLEIYSKKKRGPTFQKQLSDFMETSRSRASLKLMQPMQLHWALRLWRPRAMAFGILPELENSAETTYKSHC